MSGLFGDDILEREPIAIAPGAVHVPGWLSPESQRWIAARFREWASGPVPIRAAKIRGHAMSVRTVCLGWHWRPYAYTREAVDVNGNRVLDFPDWMIRLGRQAVAAASGGPAYGTPASGEFGSADAGPATPASGEFGSADSYTPDAALANYYDDSAVMGMHQDKDEESPAPVVSLSIGDTCLFRFGNTENRKKPYRDLRLASGDLFVFGGQSRLAFHGVTKVFAGTAPRYCGVESGRINITMRVTGLTDE